MSLPAFCLSHTKRAICRTRRFAAFVGIGLDDIAGTTIPSNLRVTSFYLSTMKAILSTLTKVQQSNVLIGGES